MKLITRCLCALLLSFPVLAGAAEPAGQKDRLIVGVLPYLSARALVEVHQPLRAYLERTTRQPVQIYTATSFREFVKSTANHQYDLVITAPHFARMAQLDHQMVGLFQYTERVQSLVVVPDTDRIKDVSSLRGQTIVTPDRLALTVIIGLQWLAENQLLPGRDFTLRNTVSHNSAVLSMERGEAMATLTMPAALARMPTEERGRLRVLWQSAPLPSHVFMVDPRLGPARVETLRAALTDFPQSPEGRQFFSRTGFGGLLPLTPDALNGMDRYIPETRRLLALETAGH
jgi:phosphonate transport system substrate-binding protein